MNNLNNKEQGDDSERGVGKAGGKVLWPLKDK